MEFRTLKDGRVIPIANPTPSTTNSITRPLPQKPKNYQGYRNREAFTIPNYTCKTCGGTVFYYEHPNGAKVLFDQLGPPWPKHPCYQPKVTIPVTEALKTDNQAGQNWQPLLINRVVRIQSGGLRIEARIHRGKLRFELDAAQVKKLDIDEISCKETLAMAQIAPTDVTAKISLHSGVSRLDVVSTKIEWFSEPVDIVESHENEVTNSAGSLPDTANPFVKPLASLIKPLKDKLDSATKKEVQILRLNSQRSHQTPPKPKVLDLSSIRLEQISNEFFLVYGLNNEQETVFGLDIKSRQNRNVLSWLLTNPETITLQLQVKNNKKFFAMRHNGNFTGELELEPNVEAYRAKAQASVKPVTKEIKDAPVENPFRNTVLTGALLSEIKAKLRLK